MKKKIIGIFVCMLLIVTALPVVGTINKYDMKTTPQQTSSVEWERTYGGDEFDWLFTILNTSDGGYIATGITEEEGLLYAWLLKVDADGVEQWNTVNYEFNGTEVQTDIVVYCVREVMGEGYVVSGYGRYYNTFLGDWFIAGYLWKVDLSGSTLWQKPLVNEEEEWLLIPMVFENFDNTGWMCGGIYLEGDLTSYTLDLALFKTDFDGNLLWHKSYDLGLPWEFAFSIWNTFDGGYFLAGSSLESSFSETGGFCMIKTDSEGNKTWDAVFDEPGWDYGSGRGSRQTADGGYIMSGVTNSHGNGGTDCWIIKTDENGIIEWDKTYGGPKNERHYCMDGTVDGGYVFLVIKNAFSFGGTKDDAWIINTDSNGKPEWELLIEEEGTQYTQSIVQTEDEGFIIAGRTGPMENPNSDGLIVKVGPFPHIDIEFKGGLGVKATIANTGRGDAVQVPYEMTVTGGILGFINKTVNGTIDIDAGATETISSGLLIGVGKIDVTIRVGVKEETGEGKQLLILTRI
jgi:hypothetical protein